MKKNISFVLIALGMCFVLAGCGDKETKTSTPSIESNLSTPAAEEDTSTSDWNVVTNQELEFSVYSAGFGSKDHGITVGYAGEIHYTTDGGKQWGTSENKSMCRWGMDIVDDETCYTCGNGGDVTKSEDGGKSFTRMTNFGVSEPDQCTMMSFCDKKTGLIASTKSMAITKDGAKTWNEVKFPRDIVCLRMENATTFYFIGSDFKLYKTTDGGKNWEATAMNLPEVRDYFTDAKYFALNIDGNDSYTVYAFQKSTKKLVSYSTTDNWRNFTMNEMPEIKQEGALYLNHDGNVLSVYLKNECAINVLAKKDIP